MPTERKPSLKERFVDACTIVTIIAIAIILTLFFVALADKLHKKRHNGNGNDILSGLIGNNNNNKKEKHNGNNNNNNNNNLLADEEILGSFKYNQHTFDLLSPEFIENLQSGEFIVFLETIQIDKITSLMLGTQPTQLVDQKLYKRTQRLLANLSFNLIDMNKDKKIEKQEWSQFMKEVFPNDYQKYNTLFQEMNGGKDVNELDYLMFLGSSKFAEIQSPTTPRYTIKQSIQKIILMNDNNYQQTILAVFQIFDVRSLKVISKTQAIQVLVNLGSPLKKATAKVNQFFKYAEENNFLTKKDEIRFQEFEKISQIIHKTLKIRYLKDQNQFRKSEGKQEPQITGNSYHFNIDESSVPDDSLVGMFSMKMKRILNVLLKDEYQSKNKEYQAEVDKVVEQSILYEFDVLDTNADEIISLKEFEVIAKFLAQNLNDYQMLMNWFKQLTGDKKNSISKKEFTDIMKQRVNQIFIDKNNQLKNKQQPLKPFSQSLRNARQFQENLSDFLQTCNQKTMITQKFIFQILDADNNGSLSPMKLRQDLTQLSPQTVSVNKVNQMIKKSFQSIKKNGASDGNSISKEEWIDYLVNESKPDSQNINSSVNVLPQLLVSSMAAQDSTSVQTLLFFFGL